MKKEVKIESIFLSFFFLFNLLGILNTLILIGLLLYIVFNSTITIEMLKVTGIFILSISTVGIGLLYLLKDLELGGG